MYMDVNAISTTTAAATAYSGSKTTETATASATATTQDSTAVVYEPSKEVQTGNTKKKYTQNTELVNKLKADAEARTAQLRSLVEKMFTKQGQTLASTDDMWKFLASGDFEVDAATKAQAQEDISEDGYWGVKQTSERILSFAKALTGGDPDKIEEMRNAFEKGFKEATKSWGKELPDISQQTYDAVMKGFDEWAGVDSESE